MEAASLKLYLRRVSESEFKPSAHRPASPPARTAAQVSQSVGPPGGGCFCLRSSLVGRNTKSIIPGSGSHPRRSCAQSPRLSASWLRPTPATAACTQCCLTLRWSRLAPVWHLARRPVWSIIRPAGQAPHRRSRLSSNVRQHQPRTLAISPLWRHRCMKVPATAAQYD